jgi:DNA-binding SARP family transcriptional activator
MTTTHQEPSELEIRVLGSVTVRLAGQRVHIGDAKHRLLLAMLVAAEGRLVSTEQLIDQIWDDQPPRTARNLIHSYTSDLRRYFEAGHAGAADILPRHHDGGYRLRVSRDSVDLFRFHDLAAQARRLKRHDDAQAATLLRQALSLWDTGPLVGSGDGPYIDLNTTPAVSCQWLEAHRHTLREEHRAALIGCLEAELRIGEHEQLISELIDLTGADPLDERLASLLLIAYYRGGRQGEAVLAYRRIRERLLSELGVEPGQDLRDLYQEILRQDPRLDLSAQRNSRSRTNQPRVSSMYGLDQELGTARPAAYPDTGPLASETHWYKVRGHTGVPARYVGIACGDLRRVRDADVWVNSENTSMQMARFEEYCISSVIRYEGAIRDQAGRVVDDVIASELSRKLGQYAPVLPGTVVATGPGELVRYGVSRVLHVAAVQGEPGAGYRQIREIGRCVTNVMTEIDNIGELPQKTTVLFPILGVGQGGGQLESTVNSMLGAALDYFDASAKSKVSAILFLAYTKIEISTCSSIFSENTKIFAVDAGAANDNNL